MLRRFLDHLRYVIISVCMLKVAWVLSVFSVSA
jgi:hypothetical protein